MWAYLDGESIRCPTLAELMLTRAFVDGIGTDQWQQAGTIAAAVENFARGFANGMGGEESEKLEAVSADDFIPLFKRDEKTQPAAKEDAKSIAAFQRRIAAQFGG